MLLDMRIRCAKHGRVRRNEHSVISLLSSLFSQQRERQCEWMHNCRNQSEKKRSGRERLHVGLLSHKEIVKTVFYNYFDQKELLRKELRS